MKTRILLSLLFVPILSCAMDTNLLSLYELDAYWKVVINESLEDEGEVTLQLYDKPILESRLCVVNVIEAEAHLTKNGAYQVRDKLNYRLASVERIDSDYNYCLHGPYDDWIELEGELSVEKVMELVELIEVVSGEQDVSNPSKVNITHEIEGLKSKLTKLQLESLVAVGMEENKLGKPIFKMLFYIDDDFFSSITLKVIFHSNGIVDVSVNGAQ